MDHIIANCPVCGHNDVQYLAKRQEYLCPDCRHFWSLLKWPPGLEPETLPTYLALPLASLLGEPHPRLRLHWLIDCAEIAVRWTVAVTLAQVIRADPGTGTGRLPPPIAARIREHIERPTLGRWLNIMAVLSAAHPVGPVPAPAIFKLHQQVFAPRFLRENQGGTLETSLLLLRNRLAHGAGVGVSLARTLLEAHEPGLFTLIHAVAQATADIQVIALHGDQTMRLVGPHPSPIPRPELLQGCQDGPWLVGGTDVLPLLPLAGFAPVCRIDRHGQLIEKSAAPVIQLYQRAESERLTYVPFGSDEGESLSLLLDEFRALFRLDSEPVLSLRRREDPEGSDFLRQARIVQEDLVGRTAERAVLKAWLKDRDTRQPEVTRIGLMLGGPGIGKSLLMARLAADIGNSRPDQLGLFFYQFHAGDTLNSPRAFFSGLLATLTAWLQLADPTIGRQTPAAPEQDLLETVRSRLFKVEALLAPDSQARQPRFLVMADGLDEILPVDPRFPQQLRSLALPGTIWMFASRPEPAVVAAFSGHGCEILFPNGVPPMSATDIRAMLYEGLANTRHALIGRDQDTADPDAVSNPFVERVVACADGLPLYVHLLLEDLRHGQLTVWDEQRLPVGLVAYYDELLNRIGLSDLKRDLPLLIACLARAEEPLDLGSLALLLADVPAEAPRYHERVRNAARAGQALLRTVPIGDGVTGLTLYHQSFRDYVGGRPASDRSPATLPAAALRGTVRDAENKLCTLARNWAELPLGHLRNHLLHWGVRYDMRWQGTDGLEVVRKRLTDFTFLQAFTRALPGSAIRDLVNDYETLLAQLTDGPVRQEFRLWEAFFREREHMLRRGDPRWPAYKILLQLAVEHGDDSPVTQAAEAWLAAGQCDWVWLRNPRRVKHAVPSPCLRTLEGHTGQINGAIELSDGRILSWSDDQTLRLWDGHHGSQIAVFDDHDQEIMGAGSLPDGRIVSCGCDYLYLWDAQNGNLLARLDNGGHVDGPDRALPLPDGRILTLSRYGTICLCDTRINTLVPFQYDHDDFIDEVIPLVDGTFLFWSYDHSLYIWDGLSEAPSARFSGHTGTIWGALQLSAERILSWSQDTLHLWDIQSTKLLAVLTGHSGGISGAMPLPDGRILSWSDDQTLRLWDGQNGQPLGVLRGHSATISAALLLPEGQILSWSDDQTLRLWDGQNGTPLGVFRGHSDRVVSPILLADGRILSQSSGGSLFLWNLHSGVSPVPLSLYTGAVDGALPLRNGHLLTWAGRKLEIWDLSGLEQVLSQDRNHFQVIGQVPTLEASDMNASACEIPPPGSGQHGALGWHIEGIEGTKSLPDGHILAWLADGTLQLRDSCSGDLMATFVGHTDHIGGVLPLPDERILSWSDDGTLRLWDLRNGSLVATLIGHSDPVRGTRLLSNGRFLSWTDSRLRLWDAQNYTLLATQSGPTASIESILPLPDGSVLLRYANGSQHLLGRQNGATQANHPLPPVSPKENSQQADDFCPACSQGDYIPLREQPGEVSVRELVGHCQRKKRPAVSGAIKLPNGTILGWYRSGKLYLWDGKSGAHLASLIGHTNQVEGALILPEGRFLTWSADCTLRLWYWQKVVPPATLAGHTGAVLGTLLLSNGRILSWSTDLTLRMWDGKTGTPLATLSGHTREISGVRQLTSGDILSWSLDGMLRVWDQQTGAMLTTLVGGSSRVTGALRLSDGRLVSWGDDATLRIWDGQYGDSLSNLDGYFCNRQSRKQLPNLADHIRAINDVQALHNGGLLLRTDVGSRSYLYVWADQTSARVQELEHFLGRIERVIQLTDNRIFAWSKDGNLRWWDLTRQSQEGHILEKDLPWEIPELLFLRNQVQCPEKISGQITSWSFDNIGGLANCTAQTPPVCWHDSSEVHVRTVLPNGILELGEDGGNDCLALFRGAKRISIEDYEKNPWT